MSNALDHVRNNCGIAGEEVAGLVDALEKQLAKCERKSEMDYAVMAGDNALITSLKNDLATVTAERDELVAALKLADYIINGSDKVGGLLYCIDGYYADVMKEELAQFDAVLAKFNDDKTGDVS